MSKRELPAGFIVPAQPVERTVPPSGPEWVHEIKHDGYRLIVCKTGGFVQLFTRNGTDFNARFTAIASSVRRLKAESCVLDGEAVVVGPDGLSQFEALRRRDAADKAVLFAFDLLERELPGSSAGGAQANAGAAAAGRRRARAAMRSHCQGRPARVRARLPARRRGDRVEAARTAISVGTNGKLVKVKNPAAVEAQRKRSENWNG
jgi:hypothetical protein